MDSSSRNLLDLLNNKQKSDKEQLLALFAPKSAAPTKSPTIPERDASPRSTTTRSGNANDLLATLMGSTSPRTTGTPASRAGDSEDLLSTLMRSSRQATPSMTPSAEFQAQPATQTSYVNPRHEYLSASPHAQSQPKKTMFETKNPFDDLEQASSSHEDKVQHRDSYSTECDKRILTSQDVGTNPTAHTEKRHASAPAIVPPIAAFNSPKPAHTAVSIHSAAASVHNSTSELQSREMRSEEADVGVVGSAFRLPSGTSSVYRLPTAWPVSQFLEDPSPVTRMTIKNDILNRNIIAASRKYFAYPVQRDGSSGGIRIVDQDTGETTLLEEHQSKVINLSFAKTADADGSNALLSTDVNSNIIVWSVSSPLKVQRIFEVAGPSDTTHKSRAKWNIDGNYFGVAITSRIFVFDYRSIAVTAKPTKIKLHPDARHCLCICKAEKAIKDFSFSLDNTSVAGVDKLGNVRLWVLDSNGQTVSPTATISTGDRSLFSVEFVGPSHVITGIQSNESLLLVDIQAAKNAQELKFPAPNSKETYNMNARLTFVYEAGLVLLNNEARQSIYLAELDLPSSSKKTSEIVSTLSSQSSHIEASGSFKTVGELGLPDAEQHKLLGYACVSNADALDCFLAHERGYLLYQLKNTRVRDLFTAAQALDSSAVTKLPSIGNLAAKPEISKIEAQVNGTTSSESAQPKQPGTKAARKSVRTVEPSANGSMSVEPRTAEIAARIEANIRSTLTSELQKANSSIKNQIESLQKDNDARHEDILRLVSETLSKNTTKVLKSTVSDAVQQAVLPALKEHIEATVSSKLQSIISNSLESIMTKELERATHVAVETALTNCGIVSQVQAATSTMTTDMTARHKHMEQNLAGALVRLDAQILERQRADSEKIDKLLQTVDLLERRITALSVAPSMTPRETVQHRPPQHLPTPQPEAPIQAYQAPANGLAPPQAAVPDEFTKYHDLIMDFVTKTQKISAGDYEGVSFVRQFLSWHPDARVKDGICGSLASDQLQLLAFIHALASELTGEDAYNRVHWIASAFTCLEVARDTRLVVLGPRLLNIIRENLVRAREQAPPNSQYKHLLELVLSQIAL